MLRFLWGIRPSSASFFLELENWLKTELEAVPHKHITPYKKLQKSLRG